MSLFICIAFVYLRWILPIIKGHFLIGSLSLSRAGIATVVRGKCLHCFFKAVELGLGNLGMRINRARRSQAFYLYWSFVWEENIECHVSSQVKFQGSPHHLLAILAFPAAATACSRGSRCVKDALVLCNGVFRKTKL